MPDNSPNVQWKTSNGHVTQSKFKKYSSLIPKTEELSKRTLVFELEGALLKSSSLFPYFMLVAFEYAGIFRALILLLLYPIVCLVSKEVGLKWMVFLCFVGIRKEKYRIGSAVLPKFFLEDVACEGYEVVKSCEVKIGVSNLPRIMVEGFLKDYIGVKAVVGRELKEVWGYYVGLMEDKKAGAGGIVSEFLGEEILGSCAIGLGCFSKSLDQQIFRHCKEVYLVTEAEKRKWQILPREKHHKPLIFHDGRLAFRPTPLATLAMFMWLPLGFFLVLIRLIAGLLLPYKMASFILALTGTRLNVSKPDEHSITSSKNGEKPGGQYG
ncbi:hypothetical protein CFOL_v3_02835 [Cephalotus follicularis]|uniref:Glycerol-3-phosphate acyltransferase RAM2/GPAT1-8 HAD-like domain-containing protein n=1 Tax=Cephalotus follicularis TaxID=3775 RepID=A0A1Q3AUH9_CEPFO|nr:hypothetical protein CFOL_v3_02835 [Cephalotus follicularis]